MSLHKSTRAKEQSRAESVTRRAGYKSGGAVGPVEAVHKHEKHLHKGEPETKLNSGGRIARKRGGEVKGDKPAPRLDRRARGGNVSDLREGDTRHPKMPTYNADVIKHKPEERARGGSVKKRAGNVNVIINTGGDKPDDGMAKMAALAAMAPKGPPPMPPGPPMAGPPMGGPPPGIPPMRAAGGKVTKDAAAGEMKMRQAGRGPLEHMKAAKERKGEISVRAHTRRRGGACT